MNSPTQKLTSVSLYVVRTPGGEYFAGFDANKKQASFVNDPLMAKKFTNKYDVKLRPDEMLVELVLDLANCPVSISEPFRPSRRKFPIRTENSAA